VTERGNAQGEQSESQGVHSDSKQVSSNRESVGDSENKPGQGQSSGVTAGESLKGETVPVRELVQVLTEDTDDGVHIEVTALPASGRPLTPQVNLNSTLKGLSSSDTWQFKPSQNEYMNITSYPSGTKEIEFYHSNCGSQTLQPDIKRPYSAFDSRLHKNKRWSKNIVKPENYCFHCIPDTMSTKVGRSAGRMPGGAQSPTGQVLRMSRRQNEYYKKAPPVRSAPSIPSPHHTIAKQSPRQGQQYSTELEHHARKVNSPRHFMEQGKRDGSF